MIQIFGSKKEVMNTTDAIKHDWTAIISQEGHSVIYISRKLKAAEKNYSDTKKNQKK